MIVYDWESKGHIPEGAYEVCKGEVKVRLGNYLEAGGGVGGLITEKSSVFSEVDDI